MQIGYTVQALVRHCAHRGRSQAQCLTGGVNRQTVNATYHTLSLTASSVAKRETYTQHIKSRQVAGD